MIVSKVGFTADAVAFARYKNIELVELRKPTDEDWEGRVKDIRVNIDIKVPEISEFRIAFGGQEEESETASTLDISTVEIQEPEQGTRTLGEIVKGMIEGPERTSYETQTLTKAFPPSTMASGARESPIIILSFQFSLSFKTEKVAVEINGEDRVAMIMKSHFSNRRHVITHDEEIRESDP